MIVIQIICCLIILIINQKKDLIKYFEYYDYKYVFLDFPFKDMITNYFQRKINKKIIFFLQKQKKKISHKYINKIVKYLKRKK